MEEVLIVESEQELKQNCGMEGGEIVKAIPEETTGRKARKQYQRINRPMLNQLRKRFQQYNLQIQKNAGGCSLRQIAQQLNISYSRLMELWHKWNDDSTLMNYSFNTKHSNFRGKSFKTYTRRQMLQQILSVSRLYTRKEIATEILLRQKQIAEKKGKKIQSIKPPQEGHRRYNKTMNEEAVGRLLRQYGYRRKRVRLVSVNRNNPQYVQKRYEYCIKMKEMYKKQEQIYYIGECLISLQSKRQFGWGKKDEQIDLQNNLWVGKCVSLMAIMGKNSINHYETKIGSHTNESFSDTLTRLFAKIRAKTSQNPKYVIMDISRTPDQSEAMKIAGEFNFSVIFLPPYSPQLNPVQNWFCIVKPKVRKSKIQTENELLGATERICAGFTSECFITFYEETSKYIDLGINKAPF